MEVDIVLAAAVGAVVSYLIEYVLQPLWPQFDLLGGRTKGLIIMVITGVSAYVLLQLVCAGYLPALGVQCPESQLWLQVIVSIIFGNVGGQTTHKIIKKPEKAYDHFAR